MNSLTNKIVIYDENCNLCKTGAMMTLEYSRFPVQNISAYGNLSNDLQEKIDYGKFRNEMAVIDIAGSQTLYGLEGILFVLGCRFSFLGRIRKDTFIFNLINFFYRIIAYNRYILFPIKSTIACSCEPPFNRKYRMRLIYSSLIFSILFSSIFGLTLNEHIHKGTLPIVLYTLIAVGTGWVMQIIFSIVKLKGESLMNYLGNLGVIMVTGQLILLPGMFTVFLHSSIFYFVTAVCILTSFIKMISMHAKRTRLLRPHFQLTFSLIFFLSVSATITIAYLLNFKLPWTF